VDLAAYVGFDGGEEGLAADGKSGLIVIELEVLVDHGAELGKITVVVCVEECGVETGDGFV
jgi:hypothetical protein